MLYPKVVDRAGSRGVPEERTMAQNLQELEENAE
jgi:hypothetical protein